MSRTSYNFNDRKMYSKVEKIVQIDGKFIHKKQDITCITRDDKCYFTQMDDDIKPFAEKLGYGILPDVDMEKIHVGGTGPQCDQYFISAAFPHSFSNKRNKRDNYNNSTISSGSDSMELNYGPRFCPTKVYNHISGNKHLNSLRMYSTLDWAVIYEVKNILSKNVQTNLAYAYLMIKVIDEALNRPSFKGISLEFSQMWDNDYSTNIEKYIEDNEIYLVQTIPQSYSSKYILEEYRKMTTRYSPGRIFLSSIKHISHHPEFYLISMLLHSRKPQTDKENVWNAMCLFSAILLPGEFTKMMNEAYSIAFSVNKKSTDPERIFQALLSENHNGHIDKNIDGIHNIFMKYMKAFGFPVTNFII